MSDAPRSLAASHSRQPRILITRLSAIGDCVQTVPLAWALRERFPGALIVWAVEAAAAPLVAAVPAVDEVIVVPKRMLASPAAAWQVRNRLRPWRFDIAIDPQSLSKSSAVGWLSGAARRIGFAPPTGREVSLWLNNELVAGQAVHVVERYLELLGPLGAARTGVRFDLHIDGQAQRAAAAMVEQLRLTSGYAVVNPGAGWDSKRWPAERFAAVIERLGREHGLPSLIVWAGQQEKAAAESIARQAGACACVAPRTSLLELAALLQQARLMVAADTGPLHLAAALGTPCVSLYGSTNKEVCGPYGTQSVALQAAYDGSAVRKLRGADNWAVRRIAVDDVMEACGKLLAGPPAEQRPLAALCSNAH
jgi:lipopolysaccharide heptosyltransferase I